MANLKCRNKQSYELMQTNIRFFDLYLAHPDLGCSKRNLFILECLVLSGFKVQNHLVPKGEKILYSYFLYHRQYLCMWSCLLTAKLQGFIYISK